MTASIAARVSGEPALYSVSDGERREVGRGHRRQFRENFVCHTLTTILFIGKTRSPNFDKIRNALPVGANVRPLFGCGRFENDLESLSHQKHRRFHFRQRRIVGVFDLGR